MPDDPEVPEIKDDLLEPQKTVFVPETSIELGDDGSFRILLDEAVMDDLASMLDQNAGGSPGCISKPGGPSC